MTPRAAALLSLMITAATGPGAARAGGPLTRGAPEVGDAYRYKSSSQAIDITMGAGRGAWRMTSRRSWEDFDYWDLTAKVSFTEPPPQVSPGQTFPVEVTGTLSGTSYGGSPGCNLIVEVTGGKAEGSNILRLLASGFPKSGKKPDTGSVTDHLSLKVTVGSGGAFGIKYKLGSTGYTITEYKYARDGAAAASPPAGAACRFRAEYEDLKRRVGILTGIKDDPARFGVDVAYKQHPFEICIEEGRATLKSKPEVYQRVAGGAAAALEMLVGAAGAKGAAQVALTGGAADAVGGDVGKAAADAALAAAKRRGRAAGYMSFRDIKAAARRAEVIGSFSKDAASSALKPLEPGTFLRSEYQGLIETALGGGPVEVPADQGLEIYRELLAAAEVVRANNEALYCRVVAAQAAAATELLALAREARAASGVACAAGWLRDNEAEIKAALAALTNAISNNGRSHWDAKFGNSWMFDAQFGRLSCTDAARAKVRGRRKF